MSSFPFFTASHAQPESHRVLMTVKALSAHPVVKGQETKKVASDSRNHQLNL